MERLELLRWERHRNDMLFPGRLGSDIPARPAANRAWSSEVISDGSPCILTDLHSHAAREILRLYPEMRVIRFNMSEWRDTWCGWEITAVSRRMT